MLTYSGRAAKELGLNYEALKFSLKKIFKKI
jgi:hypothetical protein